MTKINQNIQWRSGDHHDIDVAIKDADGDAQNITGWSFSWALARSIGDTAVIAKSSSSASEIEVTSAVAGLLTIHILPADTKPVGGTQIHGIFAHELQSTDGSSSIATEFEGRAIIDRDHV